MIWYKRFCNTCGKYYEGQGKKYCCRKCSSVVRRGFILNNLHTLSDNSWYPKIPTLCKCNCKEIVWNNDEWVSGHNSRIEPSMKGKNHKEKSRKRMSISHTKLFLLDENKNKEIYPSIPSLCECKDNNCNEIVYNGNKYINGHNPHLIKYLSSLDIEIRLKQKERVKRKQKVEFRKLTCSIPSLCKCGCKEITWNGKEYINGHNRPTYIDGRSFEPYCFKFNDELKEAVRIRDNHTCQNCGAIQDGRKHTCHHIHYDKENCYPDLITLCNLCNIKANKNRSYWESYYMNKLNDRQLLFWTRRR